MRHLLSMIIVGLCVLPGSPSLASEDSNPPASTVTHPADSDLATVGEKDVDLNYTRRMGFGWVAWHNRATREATTLLQDRAGTVPVATGLLAASAVSLLTPVGSAVLYLLPFGSTQLGSLCYGLTLCNATSYACDRAAEENGLKCTSASLARETSQLPGKLYRTWQRWYHNCAKTEKGS